jgi:hypothetical protein
MGVTELVTEMKGDEDYGRAFDSEDKGGSGPTPGSMKRTPTPSGKEMSSVDKISAGLQKGQHNKGLASTQ